MHAGVVAAAARPRRGDVGRLRGQPALHVHASSRRARAAAGAAPPNLAPEAARSHAPSALPCPDAHRTRQTTWVPQALPFTANVRLQDYQAPGSLHSLGRGAPAEGDANCDARIRCTAKPAAGWIRKDAARSADSEQAGVQARICAERWVSNVISLTAPPQELNLAFSNWDSKSPSLVELAQVQGTLPEECMLNISPRDLAEPN